MKTYANIERDLIEIGFKDISHNYTTGAAVMLHVGYGHNQDRHPRYQLRVVRTQEGGVDGSPIHFVDWLEVTGEPDKRVTGWTSVWAAGVRLADRALQSNGGAR